jgi:hypothetical protein
MSVIICTAKLRRVKPLAWFPAFESLGIGTVFRRFFRQIKSALRGADQPHGGPGSSPHHVIRNPENRSEAYGQTARKRAARAATRLFRIV